MEYKNNEMFETYNTRGIIHVVFYIVGYNNE